MRKISIIVPCYNQSQFLDACLHSVFTQSHSNWECIIVNDGSTDRTEEISLAWCKKDDRFFYNRKENGGLSSARNIGLEASKGNYIQFLDADDLLDVKKLELSLAECEKVIGNKQKIVISNFRMFVDDLSLSMDPFCELKEEYFNFNELLFGWDYKFSIPIHCGFFESSLFKNFKFTEDLKAKEDWIMWLNIFKSEPHVFFIDSTLAYYRTHDGNMSKNLKHMEINSLRVINYLREVSPEKYFIDYLCFVLEKKQLEVIDLKLKISNIENSRGFKMLEKLKEKSVVKFIFNQFKYFLQ